METKQTPLGEQPRERDDVFKAWMVKGAAFDGTYEMPALAPSHAKPEQLVPFDKALNMAGEGRWIHFYIDDRRFECVWNNPKAYIKRFRQFGGVLSTDYSIYRDMPLAMQIWNTYRNRALAYWMQKNGVEVVPNVQWGDERSYEFCFDGLPKHSTVAVSTYGCIRDKTDRVYFKQGLAELVRRLEPERIINYSYAPDDIYLPYQQVGLEIIQIPNWIETVRKKVPS